MMSSLNLHNRAAAGELVPGKTPYEERSNRKLLLHVPRAADSGQSAPFPPTGNIDRASDSRRSGQSSSHLNMIPSPTDGVNSTINKATANEKTESPIEGEIEKATSVIPATEVLGHGKPTGTTAHAPEPNIPNKPMVSISQRGGTWILGH